MAAKKSIPKAKAKPKSTGSGSGSDADPEALRLRSLAVSRLQSSAFKSALKYARRARRLSPSLPGIDLMVTALKILRCSPDDHYRVLLLHPLSPLPLVQKQHRTLTLTLEKSHPSSVPGAAEALERISASFLFLSDPTRKERLDERIRIEEESAAAPKEKEGVDSFWTACGTCRLLHEFDRKYIGHRLICPGCKKSFLAVETKEEEAAAARVSRVTGARSKSRSRPRIPEKTLAQIQMEIARERADKKRKSVVSVKEEEEAMDMSLTAVGDAEFYNFDEDRAEKSFVKGQVWAIYDDDDGMPRHYGLVEDVVSLNPFRVRMRWLDVQMSGDEALALLEKSGQYLSSGRFKVGRTVNIDSVNLFSHLVGCERAAKEVYRIYPKKGSVWALYPQGGGEEEERRYDIVVFLTSYSETYGLSMAYLEKVEGFNAVFKRREVGCHAVRLLEKDDVRLFSHQIPARKLSYEEDESLPKECWELDPASLPSETCLASGRKRLT
ncbi:uncharacterized protein M6B38_280805 [Iris pallida]|uniref:J domain-containing protein n=1 Tax=Iris pallida TaxID=29817 RepID=A0AAX6HZF1_IRIPA|nr:uncharacterized protein M6B38_280805 [Iris pallida]